MTTEVTLIIRDPRGRPAAWWAGVLERPIEDRDAEIVEFEEEDVSGWTHLEVTGEDGLD